MPQPPPPSHWLKLSAKGFGFSAQLGKVPKKHMYASYLNPPSAAGTSSKQAESIIECCLIHDI